MPRVYTTRSPYVRFWEKIRRVGDCWLWTGYIDPATGYGRFYYRGQLTSAHRASYEMHVGPIPDGMQIDHVKARGCTSRACVNPDHLEPVTLVENLKRGDNTHRGRRNRQKTHCPQGHPYDEANTYRNKDGGRMCRTCLRQRAQRARTPARH